MVEIKGESSISIRKGKKIVIYEYQIHLKWMCNFLDQLDKSLMGEYYLPEISNDIADDGEEWIVETRITGGNMKDEAIIN